MPSSYAKALKHIALRGKTALGPSIRDLELQLYRKSLLPPDYRPPKMDKWDDMIERWAYAWQFPLDDDASLGVSRSIARTNREGLRRLTGFCARIRSDPPYVVGKNKYTVYPLLPSGRSDEIEKEHNDQIQNSSDTEAGSSSIDPHASSTESSISSSINLSNEISKHDQSTKKETEHRGTLAPSEPLSVDGIPVAYLEFGAPITAYSKELALLLASELGLSYDMEGIKSAVRALALIGNCEAASTLFEFSKALGLGGREIVSYNALIAMYARLGQVNDCMFLIEEAKSKGITPNRITWTTLMGGFIQAHDCSSAIQIYDHMKALANIEPDEATFAVVLWAHARDTASVSSVIKCVDLFEHMQTVYHMMPLRQCFDAVLFALQRSPKDFHLLLEYGRKMEILGFEWSDQTFRYIMLGCARKGDVPNLRKIFVKLQEHGKSFKNEHLLTVFMAYSFAILKKDYTQLISENKHPKDGLWKEAIHTCTGVLKLIQRRATQLDLEKEKGNDVTADLFYNLNLKVEDSFAKYWTSQGLSSLLYIYSSILQVSSKHYPQDLKLIEAWENQGKAIWDTKFAEAGIAKKPPMAYVSYLKFLSFCKGEVSRAESVFQELALQGGAGPHKIIPKSVYVSMIMLHLRSAEEGSTSRALSYLDVMDKVGYPITVSLLRKIRFTSEEASYLRNMKRRSRRMEQAREDFIQYQEQKKKNQNPEGVQVNTWAQADTSSESTNVNNANQKKGEIHHIFQNLQDPIQLNFRGDCDSDTVSSDDHPDIAFDPTDPLLHLRSSIRKKNAILNKTLVNKTSTKIPTPSNKGLPILSSVSPLEPQNSLVNYWDNLKYNTLSKHELFDSPSEDGTPRGESFEEKNEALRKLGIESFFPRPEDVPKPERENKLVPLLRSDGSEPEGALWAVDGSGYKYPESRLGPFGWDTTFWRERNLLKKLVSRTVVQGKNTWLQNIPFSDVGKAMRTVPEQIEIEKTQAKTPAELADARAFPHEVYDDGSRKPVTEHSRSIPLTTELIWVKELQNPIAPYMDDEDMQLETYPETQLLQSATQQQREVVDTLRSNTTDTLAYAARQGLGQRPVAGHRNRKYDYLKRFQDMYQKGQLEVPEEPFLRFGRSAKDMTYTTAAAVKAFYHSQHDADASSENKQRSYRPISEERVRQLLYLRKRELARKMIRPQGSGRGRRRDTASSLDQSRERLAPRYTLN